ncbi:MAG: hypothetical protein MUF54_18895, partial [Polyangiaceae bacterium]|nr:hypothetical protein [Polyangiaceae bacterium]
MSEQCRAIQWFLLSVLTACGGGASTGSPPAVASSSPYRLQRPLAPEPAEPSATEPEPEPKATLAVFEVDDALDPFADPAPPKGIDIVVDRVSWDVEVHYASLQAGAGESLDEAKQRLAAFTGTLSLPPNRFFGFWKLPPKRNGGPGWRTYLLSDQPIATDANLASAFVRDIDDPQRATVYLEFDEKGKHALSSSGEKCDSRRVVFMFGNVIRHVQWTGCKPHNGRVVIDFAGIPAAEIPT